MSCKSLKFNGGGPPLIPWSASIINCKCSSFTALAGGESPTSTSICASSTAGAAYIPPLKIYFISSTLCSLNIIFSTNCLFITFTFSYILFSSRIFIWTHIFSTLRTTTRLRVDVLPITIVNAWSFTDWSDWSAARGFIGFIWDQSSYRQAGTESDWSAASRWRRFGGAVAKSADSRALAP